MAIAPRCVILSAENRGYSGGAGPAEDDPADDGNTWTRMD